VVIFGRVNVCNANYRNLGVGLGGTKGGDGKWHGCVGKAVWGLLFLWSLCVFGYISVVVEEGICDRDCRGLSCV
jgi:hypothetical protein